ncbi:MAG: cytochrome c oxidase assembly protein [Pseudomonadota bacterium]|nr:cytochrome c oxidase assembly protein [Pseudomonadota bacterium]MDO7710746.1 cytochrome c oxidase assembly protein [Pseudomonadota bacterium]
MKLFLKPSSPAGLISIVVLMFVFGFMLVPLYTVFCEVTGLNGKTSGQYQGELTNEVSDNARTVTVQFIANRNDNLPWQFSPKQEVMELMLGERKVTSFRVVNTYDKAVVAQAIPSVSPAAAASHLHKIECFCFQQQALGASESKDMELIFFIDASLPGDITKLTLSYTLSDITGTDLVDM